MLNLVRYLIFLFLFNHQGAFCWKVGLRDWTSESHSLFNITMDISFPVILFTAFHSLSFLFGGIYVSISGFHITTTAFVWRHLNILRTSYSQTFILLFLILIFFF